MGRASRACQRTRVSLRLLHMELSQLQSSRYKIPIKRAWYTYPNSRILGIGLNNFDANPSNPDKRAVRAGDSIYRYRNDRNLRSDAGFGQGKENVQKGECAF